MSVSEEKACQLHHSFITESMLLRKVLNEGIVQMPKDGEKEVLRLEISESFPLCDPN